MKNNKIISDWSMAVGICVLFTISASARAEANPELAQPPNEPARPVTMANVGADFFNAMDLSTPGLEKVKAHVEKKEFAQALTAWRDYFVEKVRPIDFGTSLYVWYADMPGQHKLAARMVGLPAAEGAAPFDDHFGLCGPPDPQRPVNIKWFFEENVPGLNVLHVVICLPAAYHATRERIYLDKYFEVLSDYGVNSKRQWEKLSDKRRRQVDCGWCLNVGNELTMACYAPEIIMSLAVFAKSLPGDPTNRPWPQAWSPITPETSEKSQELIPPDRLANIVLCLLYDYVPNLIKAYKVALASTNQRLQGLYALAWLGRVFGEFKQGKECIAADEYGMPDFLDASVYADGGDIEPSLSYNGGLVNQFLEYIRMYQGEKNKPAWLTKFQEIAVRRAFLLASVTMPVSDLPKVASYGCVMPPEIWKDAKIRDNWKSYLYKKEVYRNIPNTKIVDIDKRAAQVYTAMWGERDMGLPSFTSVAYPYSGYYVMRDSWDMDALYLFFLANRQGQGHIAENINSVQMIAYGRHMLVSACAPHQEFVADQKPEARSIRDLVGGFSSLAENTVVLDNFSQRRTQLPSPIRVSKEPLPGRWQASDNFDFAEGCYDDGYGPAWGPGMGQAQARSRHERQIVFVRPLKFWIITDRISDDGKPHAYSQIWNFPPYYKNPPPRGNIYAGFTPEQVIADERERCVRTIDPEGPNVALHHFTTVPLVYTKLYGSKNPHRGWHSFGLSGEVPPSISMWAHWLGRGEQLLVTLIYPSRDLTGEIKNVTSLCTSNSSAEKIYGFRLEMKNGSMVTYQAAQHQNELKIGALNATAESLLLMERPDGQKRGLALGVSKLTKDGQEQGFKETDFEYAIDGGEIKISGPIKYFTTRVSVKPEGGLYVAPVKTDVFYAGPVGAQIRYALDGNMPTADSPVYTGLLEIAKTATLKAQAFRDGQAEGPVTELAFTITNLPPTPPKPDVYLSDLIPEKNQQDGENHEIIRDQACWDGFRNEGLPPIRLAGKTYGKGLSQHTDAETVFELKPEYARFVAVAGVDDCTGNKGALFFRVLVDDQLLAESPILRGTAQRYWHFDCPLPSGAKRLTLFSLHSPDNVGFNMCDWAEAGFMLRKEK